MGLLHLTAAGIVAVLLGDAPGAAFVAATTDGGLEAKPLPDMGVLVEIQSNNKNNRSGWRLDRGVRYEIELGAFEDWRDASILVTDPLRGFENPPGWLRMPFWVLRRLRPLPSGAWFQLIATTSAGDEGWVALCDSAATASAQECRTGAIVPTVDGEIRFRVNDIPYDNNHGSGTLTIRRAAP